MKLRFLPLIAIMLPLLAIYGAYGMNARLGHVNWCLPNVDGCISISRAARAGEGLFLFRLLMMPYSVVLICFWLVCYRWLHLLADEHRWRPFFMLCLGSFGALALLVYANFLGTEGEYYRFMRKYGVIFFFALTGFSQMLLVSELYRLKPPLRSLVRSRHFMFLICLLEIGLAFWHGYIALYVKDELHDVLYNMNEWNFGVLLMLFPLGLFFTWKRTGITWAVHVNR